MAIRWGDAAQVDTVLWARVGRDGHGYLHLLNGAEDDIEKLQGVHYWKLGTRWYVQQGDLPYHSDNDEDVFGPNSVFYEANQSLDDMVRKVAYKTGNNLSRV